MSTEQLQARIAELEGEVSELKTYSENLAWNLAGCSVFALGWDMDKEFDESAALASLIDVRNLRLEYEKLKEAIRFCGDLEIDSFGPTLREFLKYKSNWIAKEHPEIAATLLGVLEGEK